MVEFKDKNGQPLSLSTNLANVNLGLTPAHDLGSDEGFDQWHSKLNKIVNSVTGAQVMVGDDFRTEAVLVTPEEAQQIKDKYESTPKDVVITDAENGVTVTL